MKNNKHKIMLLVNLLFILLTGCSLPSYNLSHENTPNEAIEGFMNAIICGNEVQANELAYNCKLGSDLENKAVLVSESDVMIYDIIKNSRSYELVSDTVYIDTHHAQVVVRYTTFDMRKFKQQLSENVVEIIKQRQNDGEVFEKTSDTIDIIEQKKIELLSNPKNYYTTKNYKIMLISYKGKWRVNMSDDFYFALTGYKL